MTPASILRVETPEGIVFSFPLAAPLTRALAFSINFAAIAAGAGILAKGDRIVGILGPDLDRLCTRNAAHCGAVPTACPIAEQVSS